MNTEAVDASPGWRANPVLWLVCLLPASAVVAGLTTLGIALRLADPPLPQAYHWEGTNLDQDFSRLRAAAQRSVGVELVVREGECRISVTGSPGDAATLRLLLTNSNDAGLDRVVKLQRMAQGQYRSRCDVLPAGRWRIAIDDDANGWSLRSEIDGGLERQSLRARNPDGPPT